MPDGAAVTDRNTASARATRDVLIYGLAAFGTQAAVVLVTPFLSRSLGPDGYGQFELVLVGLNLASMLAIAGVDTAALQQFYAQRDEQGRRETFATGLAWTLAAGTVIGSLALMSARQLSGWLGGADDATAAIRVAAVTLPMLSAWRFALEGLRARRQPWRYLTSVLIASGLQLGLVLWLVVAADGTVTDALLAWLVSAAVSLIHVLAAAPSLFRARTSPARLRKLLRIGLPLLLSGIAAWSMMFVDRLLLTRLVTIDEIGVYALANKVALVLTLLIYSFNRGWTPRMLELHAMDAAAARAAQARNMVPYATAVAWLAVTVSLLAPFAIEVLGGEEFRDAIHLVPVLAAGLLMAAPMPIIQLTLLATARTSLLAWPAAIAAVVNIVAVLVLGSRYGLMGASMATAVAFGVQLVLTWALARLVESVDYDWSRLARLVLLTATGLSGGWLPRTVTWDAVRAAGVIIFPLIAFAAQIVSRGDARAALGGDTSATPGP